MNLPGITLPVLSQVIWQAPWLAPIALVMLATVAGAVLWLYPPQTEGVPSGWRWGLPLLRAAGVTAIAAAVMQPIVLRPRTTAREGAIVVLADRSHSMSVVDRDRSPAELVSLAAGLGALPPGVRQEALPGLRGKLEGIRTQLDQVARARGEAEYARLSGHGAPAANVRLRDAVERLAAMLHDLPNDSAAVARDLAAKMIALKKLPARSDDPAVQSIRKGANAASGALIEAQALTDDKLFARSEQVRAICTRLARLPREALLDLGLTQQPAGVLPNLPAGVPVYGFSFADSGDVRPVPSIVAGQTESLNLQPSGDRSDLAGALRAVMSRMGSRPVQAVVVLSDGRQVGDDTDPAAGDALTLSVPVFAVESAAPGPRRDISITGFDVPKTARAGQTVRARVTVRSTGYRNEPIDVRLQVDAVTLLATVTPLDDPPGPHATSQTATAEFEVTLPRGGPQQLIAYVLPRDGEVLDENNRQERWVRVGAAPARVLVIAGPDAGRQYASLHATLSRTPWIALREVEQEQVEALSRRSILDQDVIILCDVPVNQLDSMQWSSIEEAARVRGAGVIVCAGRDAPIGYNAEQGAQALLPYAPGNAPTWQNWPGGELGFRIAAAGELPEDADFLRHLQPVSRIFPISTLKPDVQMLLSDPASGQPILTLAPRGIGRVYFLGTDQSWRWRGERGENVDLDAFWPQMVRIAAWTPYASTEPNVWLDADDLAPEPNHAITISARLLDAYGDPVSDSSQVVHVLQDGQNIADVTLKAMNIGSGRYTGTISPGLPIGDYELELDAPVDSLGEVPADPARLQLHVATDYEMEMADVSADPRLLRRIANSSGGQFLPLDQLNTLPRRLTEIRQRQSRLVEYALWDSPYLFAFVLGCLSAEWAMRKKFGLA
jgi:hypothetical protein